VLAALLWGTSIGQASATVIINAQEIGLNTVFSFAGSLNVFGLVKFGSANNQIGLIQPSLPAYFSLNALFDGGEDIYLNVFGSAPTFGPSPGTITASVSGNSFGFAFVVNQLRVPLNYISGDPISGSTSFLGTFAGLGLTPGTYFYNFTTGLDNIQLNIISEVPEPSTLGLIGLGLLGLGAMRRRRRKDAHMLAAV
jgi:PEP-CTERM motif